MLNKFPGLQEELEANDSKAFPFAEEQAKLLERIQEQQQKKYGTMLKNAHLHLAYTYLMLQNPQSCLKHIEVLRSDFGPLAPDTEFVLSQYYNEVQTLMRNQQESVDRQMSLNNIDESKEYQVYSGATSFYLAETVPAKVMASMNQTASLASFNNISEAKRRVAHLI